MNEHSDVSYSSERRISIRAIFFICFGALCFFSFIGLLLLVRYPAVFSSGKTTVYHIAAAIYSAILIAFCVIYFMIIRPTVKLQKVLKEITDSTAENTLNILENPPVLSSPFFDIQSVINRIETLILRESNAQLMKKQAELDALQSQINPHFLYNSLDTMRGQAHMAGQANIEAMSLALSKLFRYSISSYDDLVSLEDELKAVNNYFIIQNFRFDDKFIKEYRIDPDTLQYKVPKMLIQPLVENAILHGLEPKQGKGTVIISAYTTESRLMIDIDDDGIGMDLSRLTEINDSLASNLQHKIKKRSGISIGLQNINSRMRLIYGSECHISLSSTQGIGTTVHLCIPLI